MQLLQLKQTNKQKHHPNILEFTCLFLYFEHIQ